ncbi:MAG: type I-E CRISPR-associated protein Cas7/Cse4/CasC [Dehalococcoidia bacterium]|nr:type I-E CRISPR-associated protein Cas7/Cse4/CasC [Dehalococcoidia bacterium]
MFIELHILQNFAPSNLNRDDTGAPKDCEFGGYRRARISSQAFKRAIRDTFEKDRLLPQNNLAKRTRLLVEEVARRLAAQGKSEEQASAVVSKALAGIGLKVSDDMKTEYLLFLGETEITNLTQVCLQHWDALTGVAAPAEAATPTRGRRAKQAGKEAIPSEVQAALKPVLDGKKAADVALFGRMLADLPDRNRDAASQVAHAISTNKVSMEFDFYTAVDDLSPKEETGAGMLGTVEFNSACFYRYANVDLQTLLKNLGGDEDLSRRTLDAFLRAAVTAIPTGKQNSMAAQNAPSFVFAVVRDAGLWNLANAFLKPVYPTGQQDLMEASIARLDSYWGRMAKMYGEKGITRRCVTTLTGPDNLSDLKNAYVDSLDELIQLTLGAVKLQAITS